MRIAAAFRGLIIPLAALAFTGNGLVVQRQASPSDSASSVSAFVSSIIAASSIAPQASKPSQQVKEFIALGDSFTAGIGSNGRDDYIKQSGDCRRYMEAMPLQLQEDDAWDPFTGGSTIPTLNFGACSGAKMADLRKNQLTPGESWRDVPYHNFGKPQLAVLTISGNDADFSTILNACVYRAWRPPNCLDALNALDEKIQSTATSNELISTLVQIVLRGREEKGADPPENFQLYISGYVQFWNHDDKGCDTVSWGWWTSSTKLKTDVRKKMNDLVDDLNTVIKTVADSLKNLGVIYVEGFQDAYATHRFCEPESQDYLTKPCGAKTWFWHDNCPMTPGEGPTADALETSNYTQQVLDLLIPDKDKQATISEDNPPWNINPAFNDYDSFIAALDAAQGATANAQDDITIKDWPPLSEETRRSFHPKGTAYKQHSDAFMAAIKANRNPYSTTSITAPTLCQGNQVQGPCTAGTLPSAAPYTGVQGPSCDKATGAGSPNPRIDKDKASKAAADWCAARISDGLVLDATSASPKADTIAGAAENNGDLALVVLFDVTACPADKSKTKLDFKALGQEACEMDLFGAISEVCEEDSTWTNYNKDFTLEGGTFASDCGLWSLMGQT